MAYEELAYQELLASQELAYEELLASQELAYEELAYQELLASQGLAYQELNVLSAPLTTTSQICRPAFKRVPIRHEKS